MTEEQHSGAGEAAIEQDFAAIEAYLQSSGSLDIKYLLEPALRRVIAAALAGQEAQRALTAIERQMASDDGAFTLLAGAPYSLLADSTWIAELDNDAGCHFEAKGASLIAVLSALAALLAKMEGGDSTTTSQEEADDGR